MSGLDETQLRSLVTLLDDEDPRSYNQVRRQVLGIGSAILPFLEELRARCGPGLAARVDEVAAEVRFRALRSEFAALAADRQPDLEAGALLLSRFGHAGADAAVYRAWLDRIAASVAEDIREDAEPLEAVRVLSSHLFQSLGFAGNETRYYDPDNSYLSRVIDTRRGIPVTLSVLFLLLAKRLSLPVYGVGTPGHFLIGFREDGEQRFLDAFQKGRIMALPEVKRMLVRNGYDYRPEFTRAVGPRDILVRMMRNLISIYQKMGAVSRAERLSTLVEIVLTGRDSIEDDE